MNDVRVNYDYALAPAPLELPDIREASQVQDRERQRLLALGWLAQSKAREHNTDNASELWTRCFGSMDFAGKFREPPNQAQAQQHNVVVDHHNASSPTAPSQSRRRYSRPHRILPGGKKQFSWSLAPGPEVHEGSRRLCSHRMLMVGNEWRKPCSLCEPAKHALRNLAREPIHSASAVHTESMTPRPLGPSPPETALLRRSTRTRKPASQAGGYRGFDHDVAHQAYLAEDEARAHAGVLYIGPDHHDGLGVFARIDLSPDDLSLYYRGEIFSNRLEHQRAFPTGSLYAMITSEGAVIEASKLMSVARFINHAHGDDANVVLYEIRDSDVIEVKLTKNITRGEELRMDYGALYKYDSFSRRDKQSNPAQRGAPRAHKSQDLWARRADQSTINWVHKMGLLADSDSAPKPHQAIPAETAQEAEDHTTKHFSFKYIDDTANMCFKSGVVPQWGKSTATEEMDKSITTLERRASPTPALIIPPEIQRLLAEVSICENECDWENCITPRELMVLNEYIARTKLTTRTQCKPATAASASPPLPAITASSAPDYWENRLALFGAEWVLEAKLALANGDKPPPLPDHVQEVCPIKQVSEEASCVPLAEHKCEGGQVEPGMSSSNKRQHRSPRQSHSERTHERARAPTFPTVPRWPSIDTSSSIALAHGKDWTCTHHFGNCDHNCSCCRAARRETYGSCGMCLPHGPITPPSATVKYAVEVTQRASDILVLHDGDFITKENLRRLQAQHVIEYDALARDTRDSPTLLPSQENDAPWIVRAAAAEWAWGSNIVYKGFVPEHGEFDEQQVFLDTVMFPRRVYHYRTRSGRAKVNKLIMGSFVVVQNSAADKPLSVSLPEAPLLQVDSKFGIRLAGNAIPVIWTSPHSFTWSDVDVSTIHPLYACGVIHMNPEGFGGTGTVHPPSGSIHIKWNIIRSRWIGGPGAMPVVSAKRRTPASAEFNSIFTRTMAFPIGSREDYSLPIPRPKRALRVRKQAHSWSDIFLPRRYERITAWFKRHTLFVAVCVKYCEDMAVDFISEEAYAAILKIHRLPTTLIMDDDDLLPWARGRRWFRQPSGSIIEMFDDDSSVLPSTVCAAAVHAEQRSTPWAHARMFQHLFEHGLTPRAHDKQNYIVLAPYSKRLYMMAKIWSEEARKGSAVDAEVRMFTEQSLELPSIPFILARRSAIQKPGRIPIEWRQILDMSHHVQQGSRPSVPIAPSLNARLRAARELESPIPNQELVKGVDVGVYIAIFESHDITPAMYTFDASQFFHVFACGFMNCCEQGIATEHGAGVSTSYGMGREDSPRMTSHLGAYVAEMVSKAIHELIMQDPNIDPRAKAMVEQRERIFGRNSRQSRIVIATIYVDDLIVLTIPGYDDLVRITTLGKTKPLGLTFNPEKYGASIYIGMRFDIKEQATNGSRQHIKPSKLAKYIDEWLPLTLLHVIHLDALDKLLGQLTYAATVYLELKTLSAIVNDCRVVAVAQLPVHASGEQWRVVAEQITPNGARGCKRTWDGAHGAREARTPTPSDAFPFPLIARDAVKEAITILKRDTGLPMLPKLTRPRHFDLSTITHRGDASLNEECGYSGWGLWYLVPHPTQPPSVYAIFDEWTPLEQKELGHDVPSAESAVLIFGSRGLSAHNIAEPWHDEFLQMSDSESCEMSYASLRWGSVRLDAMKHHWQELQDTRSNVPPTTVEWCSREFNTGSDLLSKNRWELFKATIRAAGLGEATRLFLSAADRDIMDLIKATRSSIRTQ